jgi:hypothetical protein
MCVFFSMKKQIKATGIEGESSEGGRWLGPAAVLAPARLASTPAESTVEQRHSEEQP